MKAPPQSVDAAQASPKSQRRRTAANVFADPPASKRTPRAIRTPDKTIKLEANDIKARDAPVSLGKQKKTEVLGTEEVPPPQSKGAAPKTRRQPREVKQEQEPLEGETRISKIEEDQEPAALQINGDIPKTNKRKRIVKVEEAEIQVGESSPKKTKRKKATEAEIDETVEDEATPKEVQEGERDQKITKRKRKTKEEKELEAMPLAVRTDGLRMFIGAHVSGAKGWFCSMYIVSIELKNGFESRGSQFSHELRPHWVNSFRVLHTGHD